LARQGFDYDQCIRRNDATRIYEQRIDVDLGDAVGVIGGEQRDARQDVRERFDRERGAAAISGEQLCRLDSP
jgi:hypothetical protein